MHYNLHERLKPKKHLPWKKVLIIMGILLAGLAVYVLAFHNNNKAPAEPIQVQQKPA